MNRLLRDHILQRMRERLEEDHEIKTQVNTPWMTTVLRFILPTGSPNRLLVFKSITSGT